jgi:hypothetical protein
VSAAGLEQRRLSRHLVTALAVVTLMIVCVAVAHTIYECKRFWRLRRECSEIERRMRR